ncbi:MAG TPA: class 1 fructose-bisphosphatase [Candidatus Binataceae bacterium]|nr:class 1 fructose-bisphosphatase [Candidatus Binataceae bacterium]
MSTIAISLTQHLYDHEAKRPELGPEFCLLMGQLGFAAKAIAREVSRAPIANLGLTGEQNATGDEQHGLDVISNDLVVAAFAQTTLVSDIVSEEMEEPAHMQGAANAHFVLCIDPLDGSSNTDANGALGSIFGVYRRPRHALKSDLLRVVRSGADQVAAGYVMYGPSTVLVYASPGGVHEFTLDPALGEFLLSRSHLRCPARGKYFGANLGNLPKWPQGVRSYVEYITSKDSPSGRPYSLRYTGAFVADIHRILVAGGIFFYPAEAGSSAGKLRLLYECAPMAFLIEQAGGRATTGDKRILDIEASNIHQRTAIAIGSADDVAAYEKFYAQNPPI